MPDAGEALLRRFKLPPPPRDGGVRAWVDDIGEHRGRPIKVRYRTAEELCALIGQPVTPNPGPSAIWLATAEEDFIVVDRHLPSVLLVQCTFHELAHVLLGHDGTHVDADEEKAAEDFADSMADVLARSVHRRRRRLKLGAARRRLRPRSG